MTIKQRPKGEDNKYNEKILLYIVTLIFPVIGLIVSRVYLFGDNPDKKELGKGLFIYGILMVIIYLITFTFLIVEY